MQRPETINQDHLIQVRQLYQQYGAALFGYLIEVFKDRVVAEQCLVDFFKDLPNELEELSKPGVNVFRHLQVALRKKAALYARSVRVIVATGAAPDDVTDGKNKFTAPMNNDERLVFCGIYRHGKTIADLAAELGKSEDTIRRILKECFTSIRNSGQ